MEIRSWEWMVNPTPQKEWIYRKGLLLWVAFFAIELGAGMYFVAFFLDNIRAMFIGWLICLVFGGGAHFAYLGKPLRFWRAVISQGWKTSWISRGLYFIGLFTVIGAIHLFLYQLGWGGVAYGLGIAMVVISILVAIYGGFAISYVMAIPSWNTALIPVLFVVSSFLGGAELAFATRIGDAEAEKWIQILMPSYMFLLIFYMWTVRNGTAVGKHSIAQMLRGPISPLFYLGVVVIGILLPLSVIIYNLTWPAPMPLITAGIAGGLIGDLSMRYCIFRCSYYVPLLPKSSY